MKAFMLFTGSGPLVIMTSHAAITAPGLLEKFAAKGIDKFIAEYVSSKAMSKDGYLANKGLVALPKAEADKIAASAKALKPIAATEVTN